MKSHLFYLIAALALTGCVYEGNRKFNVGSNQIQVTGIAVKELEIDEDGDRWYSVKATVVNKTGKDILVDVLIQGIDTEGFEITDLWLDGQIKGNEEKILTNREFARPSVFSNVVEWRLKSVDYEPNN